MQLTSVGTADNVLEPSGAKGKDRVHSLAVDPATQGVHDNPCKSRERSLLVKDLSGWILSTFLLWFSQMGHFQLTSHPAVTQLVTILHGQLHWHAKGMVKRFQT